MEMHIGGISENLANLQRVYFWILKRLENLLEGQLLILKLQWYIKRNLKKIVLTIRILANQIYGWYWKRKYIHVQ